MTFTVSLSPILAGIAGALGSALVMLALAAARHARKAFRKQMAPVLDQACAAAGDAIGIAVAWPLAWVVDRIVMMTAQGGEWRAQRRIWRADFRATMSWQEFRRQLAQGPARNAFADALGLFELAEPFGRADLDARFKRIMLAVHPDTGGSAYLARLANDARALILERKGWKP